MNINNYTYRDLLNYTLALIIFSFLTIFVFAEINQESNLWIKIFRALTVFPYFLFVFLATNMLNNCVVGYNFDEDDIPAICAVIILSIFLSLLSIYWIFSKPGTFPNFFKFFPLPGLLFYLYLNMIPGYKTIK